MQWYTNKHFTIWAYLRFSYRIVSAGKTTETNAHADVSFFMLFLNFFQKKLLFSEMKLKMLFSKPFKILDTNPPVPLQTYSTGPSTYIAPYPTNCLTTTHSSNFLHNYQPIHISTDLICNSEWLPVIRLQHSSSSGNKDCLVIHSEVFKIFDKSVWRCSQNLNTDLIKNA